MKQKKTHQTIIKTQTAKALARVTKQKRIKHKLLIPDIRKLISLEIQKLKGYKDIVKITHANNF